METHGTIGFPVGETIQPTTGRRFLWTIFGILITLIVGAVLFPTILILTRSDEDQSTGHQTLPTSTTTTKMLTTKNLR